ALMMNEAYQRVRQVQFERGPFPGAAQLSRANAGILLCEVRKVVILRVQTVLPGILDDADQRATLAAVLPCRQEVSPLVKQGHQTPGVVFCAGAGGLFGVAETFHRHSKRFPVFILQCRYASRPNDDRHCTKRAEGRHYASETLIHPGFRCTNRATLQSLWTD